MKLSTTDIRLHSKHLGEIVWVCHYNKPDPDKKPLRNVTPTECKIVPVEEATKKVYYSNTYFAPLSKKGDGSITKQVISPVDNTGYRMRAGNELHVFTTKEEAQQCYAEEFEHWNPKTKLQRIEEVLGSNAFYHAKEDQDASVLIDLLEEIDDILGED